MTDRIAVERYNSTTANDAVASTKFSSCSVNDRTRQVRLNRRLSNRTTQRTYEVGGGETEDVLTLGDLHELIWKVVGGIAVFTSRAQLDVEAAHCIVAHLEWKAILLSRLLYQFCYKLSVCYSHLTLSPVISVTAPYLKY